MKLGIMQPYFMPYIGYFQLIAAVDVFIVYDNIKYTKKGWINRNRMLLNGSDAIFSLPLKKDSDNLDIFERKLSSDFSKAKLLNQIKGAYKKAPYFTPTFKLLEQIIHCEYDNLFEYIHNSLIETCFHLKIDTKIIKSSGVKIDHTLKSQDKVLSLCQAMKASTYINAIGGTDLYDKTIFRDKGINLQFLKAKSLEYEQYSSPFIPWLSIIDVLMFMPINNIHNHIHSNYELI